VIDAKYSGVSGRYFDGFKEIPSSVESRAEAKARAVWEQSVKLAGVSREDAEDFPFQAAWDNVGPANLRDDVKRRNVLV
jgi:hypothetical protein